MPKRIPYRNHCALAAALDVVGDRWTMLIVRDLVLGPRRFGQLAANLIGIAPDVLTDRLHRLGADAVIASHLGRYELTERGRELTPVARALALWGRPELQRSGVDRTLTAYSLLTALVLVGRPPGFSRTVAFHVDDEQVVLRFTKDRIEPVPIDSPAQASVRATTSALHRVLTGTDQLADLDTRNLDVFRLRGLLAPT